MTVTKYILTSILLVLLISSVSAILTCQCDGARHPYCVSFGNTIDCAPEDRIPIITAKVIPPVHTSDGSKEHPFQWKNDIQTPVQTGWYFYVSPTRPFYIT